MAKKRRKAVKRERHHQKLKAKEREIRKSGNVVSFNPDEIERMMGEYGFEDYRIDLWGDIRLKSKFDSWIIEFDDEVIFLKHGNEKLMRVGNDRNSYHLHNVFYDFDYCVESIKEHDDYRGIVGE